MMFHIFRLCVCVLCEPVINKSLISKDLDGLIFIFHGYITNSQYDQLPVGLIGQSAEHSTDIAEVMPFQAFFLQLLKLRN